MSVKLILLKSGETVISDIKEVQKEDELFGYLFTNPQRVTYESPVLNEAEQESVVNVSLSRWMILSKDTQMIIPFDWVVTIVDPVESLMKMYEPLNQTEGEE
tara:strand:- start:313 stop:618 length:306 start_codon:yes stop_codon:yes gene_type:complete